MAKSFNIVAQLQLQGPKNLNSVVKNIQSGLKNINAKINITGEMSIEPKLGKNRLI